MSKTGDNNTKSTKDRPEVVAELEEVAHQVCEYWVKEHRPSTGFEEGRETDNRTISIVVRDGDGEMIGETQLWEYPGLYALVRVTDLPDQQPEYEDPPEKPNDHDWIYRDPPLDHHVKGVQCSQCGESNSIQFPKMPRMVARSEPWKWIQHRPGCSHASERDVEYWAGKRMAEVLRNRPRPSRMTIGALWDEVAWMRDLWEADPSGMLTDPLDYRFPKIESVLERRLNPRYPDCPECGAAVQGDHEGVVECTACVFPYDAAESDIIEVEEDYHKQRQRLWGWRGHGERTRGKTAEEVTDD